MFTSKPRMHFALNVCEVVWFISSVPASPSIQFQCWAREHHSRSDPTASQDAYGIRPEYLGQDRATAATGDGRGQPHLGRK